ncbi:hypothetical protein AWENTII_006388 [Aspergillus wentii]
MNLATPSVEYDFTIREPVLEYFSDQPWSPDLNEKAVTLAKAMVTSLNLCWPRVPHDVKIAASIFAIYNTFIEDISGDIQDEIRRFAFNLTAGQRQTSPVLQSLQDFLPGLRMLFGPCAYSVIISGVIHFLNGCLIEQRYDGKLEVPAGAVNFPSYFRQKTGNAEALVQFVFPEETYPEDVYLKQYLLVIPDFCDALNYINDILSFYKESVIGDEQLNYISNVSKVRGISPADALRLTCSSVVQTMGNIRKTLSGNQRMVEDIELSLKGYVQWHLDQPKRYHLGDLEIVYSRL